MLIPLLLLGCRPSLTFQVIRPAEVTVAPDVRSLALVDRVESNASRRWLDEMKETLRINIVNPPRFTLADRSGAPGAMEALDLSGGGTIPRDQIGTFCERAGANGVVSLRSFEVLADWDFDTRIEQLTETVTRNVNGRAVDRQVTRDVTVHSARHEVRANGVVRLYNCAGEVLDAHTLRVFDYWEGEGDSRGAARTNTGEPEDHRAALIISATETYLRHISPYEATISRTYYRRPNGSSMLKAGELKQAEQALREEARTADGKKKGRALYNLAVLKEQQGDFDSAVKLANRANRLLASDLSAELARKLHARRAQEVQVDEQLDQPNVIEGGVEGGVVP